MSSLPPIPMAANLASTSWPGCVWADAQVCKHVCSIEQMCQIALPPTHHICFVSNREPHKSCRGRPLRCTGSQSLNNASWMGLLIKRLSWTLALRLCLFLSCAMQAPDARHIATLHHWKLNEGICNNLQACTSTGCIVSDHCDGVAGMHVYDCNDGGCQQCW